MAAVLDLVPPVLGGFLGWAGLGTLADRSVRARVAATALPRLTRGVDRAVWLLRSTGLVQVVLAVALLSGWILPSVILPVPTLAGLGTAAVGVLFLGYLAYSRVTAPESSCGCTADVGTPISARDFARAGTLVVGGAAAAAASGPWWSAAAAQPITALVTVGVCAAVVVVLSADLPRWRERLFRHPLAATVGFARSQPAVPLAATLDLLGRSRAWSLLAQTVRSGLLEHWQTDGWRILRFAGVRDARPVSVLFAMDAAATVENTPEPEIRIEVVDEDTSEVEPGSAPVG